MYLERALTWALPALLLTACSSNDELTPVPNVDAGLGADAGVADDASVTADAGERQDGGTATVDAGLGDVGPFAASVKNRVKLKRAVRLRNDVAKTLGLASDEVCRELGRYDCADYVHTIALGGVQPYVLGIQKGLEDTAATTSLAVERVALTACGQRVDADLASSEPVIFAGLDIRDGTLDPASSAVEASLTTLYHRALLREPKPSEIAKLRSLYTELAADGAPSAARDWAVLSCFAVLTSVEYIFY